jgi:NAD(P)-dependent dehydrogenase (short-subunit alcohol dehydrogenase family)
VRGRGTGFKAEAAYVTAKHGEIGLTKAAALVYAQSNIRNSAMAPENIEVSMIQRFSGAPLKAVN